jgi:hypothetical protein
MSSAPAGSQATPLQLLSLLLEKPRPPNVTCLVSSYIAQCPSSMPKSCYFRRFRHSAFCVLRFGLPLRSHPPDGRGNPRPLCGHCSRVCNSNCSCYCNGSRSGPVTGPRAGTRSSSRNSACSRCCICTRSGVRPSHRSSRRSCCRNNSRTCVCTRSCNSTRSRRCNGA